MEKTTMNTLKNLTALIALSLASSSFAQAPATIFEHINFGGKSQALVEGMNLGPLALGNDVTSSVKVSGCWKVTLYGAAQGQNGPELMLTADDADLRNSNFDDIVSNVLVERDPKCNFITDGGALEARAPSGAVVWSSRSSSMIPEQTAESAKNLDFEHFGSFDLNLWNEVPSQKGDYEDEGDFATETFTYEKEGMTLEIRESEGEYGIFNVYTLKGADAKVRKVRQLHFNNDSREAEETINDYVAKPARKYTRTQKMVTSTAQMKPIPTKLSGAWVQGPADELQE